MSKGKALLKDTLVYGVGNLGARFLGLLLLPFYTAVLSTEDFGYIDLVTMGAMLFSTVASLKLFDGAYRFLWEAPSAEERTRLVSSVLNFAIVGCIVLTAACWALFAITGIEVLYLGIIVLWLLVRMPGEFFQQTARAIGKNHVYSVSGIVLAVSMLVLNLLFLGYYKLGVAGYLWAMVLSYLCSLGYCLAAASGAQYYRPTVLSLAVLRPLLAYSLPLLPAAVMWWLIRGSGRYILTHSHGLEAAGIFAVADKLPTALYMVGITFFLAWQDAVLKHSNAPDRDQFLTRAMNTYVRSGLAAVILLTVFLKPFFFVMVNETYHGAHVYVPWLLLAVFLLCLGGLYEAFFQGTKKTTGILWSTAGAALVSIALNVLLVPRFGLWATTLATLLAGATHLAIRVLQMRGRLSIRFNLPEVSALLVLMLLAAGCYELPGPWYAAGAAGVVLLLALICRTDIALLAGIVKGRLQRR